MDIGKVRSRAIRYVGLVAVFLLLSFVHGSDPTRQANTALAADKPNIVLILADDLDNRSMDNLGSIRSLVANPGIRFTNSYVSDPLCCPSRASILRGQYVHSHGITHHNTPGGGHPMFKPLEGSTIATWLNEAGYRTALVGKYLNNYDTTEVPSGWDEWYGWMGNWYDADQRTTYRINENGTEMKYPAASTHDTDLLASKANGIISRAHQSGEPFFLYFSTNAPHNPPSVAERYKGHFSTISMPRVSSYNEQDVSDKPHYIRSLSRFDEDTMRSHTSRYRARLRSMLSVRDAINGIIAKLKENGELSNTYIVFTSDNGYHMGEHRLREGKRTPYLEDVKVPLYVRGPGIPAGSSSASLISNIDLAPTFAQLAGAQVPAFVDGRSMVSALGGGGNGRKHLLVEGYKEGTVGTSLTIPTWRALISLGYGSSYVEYGSGEKEYYTFGTDPYQLQNKYGRMGSTLRQSMHDKLWALALCSGAECRQADST